MVERQGFSSQSRAVRRPHQNGPDLRGRRGGFPELLALDRKRDQPTPILEDAGVGQRLSRRNELDRWLTRRIEFPYDLAAAAKEFQIQNPFLPASAKCLQVAIGVDGQMYRGAHTAHEHHLARLPLQNPQHDVAALVSTLIDRKSV